MRRALALLALAVLTACSGGAAQQAAAPAPPPTSAAPGLPDLPVREPVVWLCRPTTGGVADEACREGLDAVVVTAAGSRPDPFEPAADPPVDCFYLYPTVSAAAGASAPKEPEPAVVATVRAQAALFGEACRLFVPVYRQVTLSALSSGSFFDPAAQDLAFADVVDAWREYLIQDNDGRGVVLVGHSQGAMQLSRLLASMSAAERARVVSALLLGGGVSVADGADVADQAGGLPACREPGQVRCVVAYSTFADVPPPGALFARTGPGRRPLCTDPTRLAGTDGALHPYVPTDRLGPLGRAVPAPDGRSAFVSWPEALAGQCREQDGAVWFDVTTTGAPAPGLPALERGGTWGLHALDVTLALGDLVEVVRRQGESWSG